MSSKVSNQAVEAWWSHVKERERVISSASIGLFTFLLLALNPITQVLWQQLSRLGVVSSGVMTSIIIACTLVGLILVISISIVAGIFLSADIGDSAERKFISTLRLKYEFLSAQNLLASISTPIHKNLFNDKTIYEVAENKEYFIGDFIFGINSKLRLIVFFIGMIITNSVLGWALNTYSFGLILLHAILTTGFFVVMEVCFGLFYKVKNKKNLLRLIDRTGDKANRSWCEYQVNILSFSSSYKKISWSSEDGVALARLAEQAKNSNAQIRKTVVALQLLIDNVYAAIEVMNNNKIQFVINSDEEKYTLDSRKLKNIINSYAPACINKIHDNFDDADVAGFFNLTNTDEQNDASNTNSKIVVAYTELYNDIVAQEEVVKSIQSYYLNLIEDSVLVGFRGVIERQAVGWDDENVFSLKTSVINESINKRVIPKLNSLMINANEEDALKLKNKIDEFKEFFRMQVAIDEQEALVKQITYERSGVIDINNTEVRKKSVVEQELSNADFYLQQLKKEW